MSHDSAVEAIWSLAQRNWKGILDNEGMWLVPDRDYCIKTQGDFKRLEADVDLNALGILHRPVDLLVPDKSCYSRGKRARFHVWSESFPPQSFVRVHDRIFVSTPYFTVLQLSISRRADRSSIAKAETAAKEDARIRSKLGIDDGSLSPKQLVQWEDIARLAHATQVLCDFMGTYRHVPPFDADTFESPSVTYQTKPLVKPEALDAYLGEMGGLRGITRARKVASLAFAKAASPMETALALMLSLPPDMGGFGLPRPTLNWEVPISPEIRDLSSQDSIVADLCWPEQRVIVEFYGWDDHFGAGSQKVASDTARANSLASLGWTVLHATYKQIETLAGISLLARQLGHALGISLAKVSDLELVWRQRLWTLLLPKATQ